MDNETRKKNRQAFLESLSSLDDKTVNRVYKSFGDLSPEEEMIYRNAPIDESDYSDYSVKRKLTPEQEKRIAELAQERVEGMNTAKEILEQRGYEQYKKRGKFGFGPDSYAFKNPKTGKILRQLPLIGPAIGAGLALASGEANAASALPILGEADNLGPEQGSEDWEIENPQRNPAARRAALEKLSR